MQKHLSSLMMQITLICGAFFWFYQHTLTKLVKDWSIDDNYSHGFLIPFITGYMIWQKREHLAQAALRPSSWGLPFLLAGIGLHIAGNIGAELFTMRFSMILIIIGLVLFLPGREMLRETLVPILYLLFMIPIPSILWNKIAFPLQLFAAKLTADAVNFMGITILREGNILHLANTSLEVVDACSGLRSLTSLLALSGAYAYISSLNTAGKWLLFFSAVPIAVLVNIIRLGATALMAHWIGADAAQGFLHDMSGMVVFVAAFLMLYGVSVLLLKLGMGETETAQKS